MTHYIHVYIHLIGGQYSDDYCDSETNLLIITFRFTNTNHDLFDVKDSSTA